MTEKMRRLYRYIFRNPPKFKVMLKSDAEKHGNGYGAWHILPNSLTSNSIVYSVGIGNDISFDLSLIHKYGCTIYGFDPTPKVITWLKTQNIPKQFLFHPIALATNDGILTFYSPKNENYVSHSSIAHTQSEAVDVPCKSLKTLMKELKHRHIDLLKMDIEGFEYDVLKSIITDNIRPRQILVEFHHVFPEYGNAKTEETIDFLFEQGYHLYKVSDSFAEFSFVD